MALSHRSRVGLKDHKDGVTDLVERVKIRAELDALVAQLYGLTEEEFAYILTTFPIVPENVKTITLETFKSLLAKKV